MWDWIFGLFGIVALVFAMKYRFALLVMTTYVVKKYTPPSDEEMKECVAYVVRNLFKLNRTGS